jgi:hypothetical protein
MFLACQQSKVTIKLNFYYRKNDVEIAKIAVDSCYVLRQFLTPLPSIDFREIRGLILPSRQRALARNVEDLLVFYRQAFPQNEKWTPQFWGEREIIFNYFPKYINKSETK